MAKLSSGKVALSTDLWSSPNKLAFMGITVATLDIDFIPIDVVIGLKHMIGEHFGTKLLIISTRLSRFTISRTE